MTSKKFLVRKIDELLTPLGFGRRKGTWNRKSPQFVDVIDLQTSKGTDAVTINAGVLHTGVHSVFWGTEPPAVVQEASCTVRARVGQLLDGKDLWWRLDDDEIVDDVIVKLSSKVLPFLDSMHSIDAMIQFLVNTQVTKHKYPPPIIHLAILRARNKTSET